MLPHAPYSSDLSLCDFHLFRPFKEHWGGQQLDTNEEVQCWLHSQKKFFVTGICVLPKGAPNIL